MFTLSSGKRWETHHNKAACRSIMRALKDYPETLKKNIIVNCPHENSNIEDVDENTIIIKFFTAYVGEDDDDQYHRDDLGPLQTVFGYHLHIGQNDRKSPSDRGEIIFDGDEPIAEFIDNNFFVLFDLPHCENENIEKIMHSLMSKFIPFLNKFKTKALETDDEFRAKFVEIYTKRADAKLNNSKRIVERLHRELADKQKTYYKLLQQIDDETKVIESLLLKAPRSVEDIEKEFQNIKNIDKVEQVLVDANSISVITENICADFRGKTYSFGKFKIKISCRDGKISITNLTKTDKNGNHHPHVFETHICWGNISESIVKLAAEYEFNIVFTIVIQFLQNITDSESYNPEGRWPLLK